MSFLRELLFAFSYDSYAAKGFIHSSLCTIFVLNIIQSDRVVPLQYKVVHECHFRDIL